jgi:hypothetical protein
MQCNILHTQLDVCKNPLTILCPLTLEDVSWPVPFFKKHLEFLLGTVGENITHVAPTQPEKAAHESKQVSKLLCVEFETSIFWPAIGRMSVAHSLRNVAVDPFAV